MKKYFLFLLVSILAVQGLDAQNSAFEFKNLLEEPKSKVRKYTTKNGFPLKVLDCITQDKDGLMWFAAEDGLARFDGNSFKVFKNDPDNPYSISHNYIQWVFTDSDGTLWTSSPKGLNRFDSKTERFTHYHHNPEDKNSLVGDNVVFITGSPTGNLWIASAADGFTYYDRSNKKFIQYSHNNLPGLSHSEVVLLYEDHQGLLWVGTLGGGLIVFKTKDGIVTQKIEELSRKDLLPSPHIRCFSPDHLGNLWIGTSEGLVFFNRKQQSFQVLNKNNSALRGNIIRALGQDSRHNLWIAVEDKGLHRISLHDFDGQSTSSLTVEHQSGEEEYRIYRHTIHAIYEDRDHNLWLGTNGDGVQMISGISEKFTRIERKQTGEYEGVYLRFWGMCTDKEGNLWLGSDGDGIYKYSSRGQLLRHYYADGKKGSLTNNAILCAYRDHSNTLWFGTYAQGLFLYDEKTDSFFNYAHNPADSSSLADNDLRVIFEDSKHNIWVGSNGGGLNLLNKQTGKFTHYASKYTETSRGSVRAIIEDKHGGLWIGCHGEGLQYLDPKKEKLQRYLNRPEDENALPSNIVYALHLDRQGKLWIGTEGTGLAIYDLERQTLERFTEKEGLGGSTVYALLEDKEGNLWMSTNSGVSKWDGREKKFYNYDGSDGLQNGKFNSSSFLYDKTLGLMAFAGTEGVTLFRPEQIKQNLQPPKVMITGFQLFNKPVEVNASAQQGLVLKQAIHESKEITLRYNQSVFTFEYTALNYAYPEKCAYAYKMEGFDKDWNYVDTKRTATYTNLDPGEYIFRVKASNDDGVWNEQGASIALIITPPYWKTWWFQTMIACIVIGSVYTFFKGRVNAVKRQKAELEEQVRQQTAEVVSQKEALEVQAQNLQALNEQLQAQTDFLGVVNDELKQQKEENIAKRQDAEKAREEAERARQDAERANQAKSIFLATMSHEIRTPMNGVLGMASLLAETPLTAEQQEYTDTIRSSGDALLTVINDILDFSKIESGNLELDYNGFDMRQCLEEVMDVFSTKASQKGLDLVYQIDYQIPAQIIGDSHRLRQILLNLISNAMKFTHKGEIFVGVDLLESNNDQLLLAFQIRDTGIGIAQDKISRLFKAFSQVDSSTTRRYGGTGLGLVISQRLVELMGGTITVESHEGVGTIFSFTIKSKASQESIRQYVHCNTVGNDGKKVLLVDDNATNLTILRTQLELWRLSPTLAISAKQALDILTHHEGFDLVITDMQMPDMDGVQLSQRIKAKHPRLPIVLLSSVGDESKKKYPDLFTSVLNKPVKQQQLCRVIQSALRPNGTLLTAEVQHAQQVLSEEFAEKYPLRILIAEDNPVNQKLAIRVLNKLGYKEIDTAQNGVEVLERLAIQHYEIILMDVQMPEMDGLEATRRIRAKEDERPVIIAMTANAMQGDREECLRAGMDDYISKPIKLEVVVNILEKWALEVKRKNQ
ncbi:hybrid sensor histidine kinase/response regulator [Ohtaekwangia koreensis]|uniref:histidine kinase n=1 Tax=Ohtaekwangia koreensis TaxID=688867 RepID=A0A1T5KMB4_9BACT|nr:two-component regulator propeller domain-containing protein [Ohtaekwangia koreensis]SKC64751.1 Signal transduction histidine kinase [Ohtaekwangia koreensis]